jgi:hypothetical protein
MAGNLCPSRASRILIFNDYAVYPKALQDGVPAFDGSNRDLLDLAEKTKLIASADFFMKMREIRNIHSHDYREDKLILFLTD